MDISDHRQADDVERKSEARYRDLFENMLEGAYQTQLDGKILSANPALVQMLGYDSEEELCTTVLAQHLYTKSEDRSVLIQKLEKEGELRNVEFGLRRKDGREIMVLENARAIRDKQGKILYIEGLLTDITERKQAEESLRQSEQRFRQIADNAMEWIWEVDTDGKYTYASPIVEEILGYKPEEILEKRFYDLFHPEDQEELRKAALQVFAEKKSFREFINRNVHKNGKTIWLSTSGVPVLDNQGNLLGYRGADIDLTERKQAEEKLKESEQRYRLLIDNAGYPITLLDLEGKILLVNNTGGQNLGGMPNDFIGRSIYEILPDKADVFRKRHEKTIKEGGELEFEDLIKLPEGNERWFWSNIQRLRDASGNILGIQIVSHDITERKQSEELLRETAEALKLERQTLVEKNVALKEILEHLESEKQDYQRRLRQDLESAIIPFLKRLKIKAGPACAKEFEALEVTLDAVLVKDENGFKGRYARLTSRESEICEMIKSGMSSKQISDDLNLSVLTVLKHREIIRRKLGITNKHVSLATYLRTH